MNRSQKKIIDNPKALTIAEAKYLIIERFNKNVRGKSPTYSKHIKEQHDGKEGHWLEQMMGIAPNKNNGPDLYRFEMKKQTRGKTTFGDWAADYYIFNSTGNKKSDLTRDEFLKLFGKKNLKKQGRYSWSGDPCPKVETFNNFGQKLLVDDQQNIIALYDFSSDRRDDKKQLIPKQYQSAPVTLAQWNCDSLRKKLERKFNQFGFFKCLKNERGIYSEIAFGSPIQFNIWIGWVRQGVVFFDSGMYMGNSRHYSQWRANNTLWDQLITEKF